MDSNGKIMDGADILLAQSSRDKRSALKKECAGNMLEIASSPHERIPKAMGSLLSDLEYALDIAQKKGVLLCPLGTYPGKFTPRMRIEKGYKIKEDIFGKSTFRIAGRCIGFHCHYTLPRGIFDYQLRMIQMMALTRVRDSLVNSYNTLIAIDPALTTLMQSSPYYQGERLGKDARLIMYRGGEVLDNPRGLYAKFQEFGRLPPYKPTTLDIVDMVMTRFDTWKMYLMSLGINIRTLSLYGSVLATTWNPVKVNPHGTLEQRGMDMNHPLCILGVGVLMKFLLRTLQRERYAVVPSEIGIKEPFKVEKDVIYVPPYPYVRTVLQKEAAYRGLESDEVHKYCKRFLKLASEMVPRNRRNLLAPLHHMVAEKKTLSDKIIRMAARLGHKNQTLSDSAAAEIAIRHSERFVEEINMTKQLIEAL